MNEIEQRELDAWLAEHLFRWEWMAKRNSEPEGTVMRRALFPPDDLCDPDTGSWIRFNWRREDWGRRADESLPRFSDWDRCCAQRDDANELGADRIFGVPRFTGKHFHLVLEACALRLKHGIVGIGSPMFSESVASNIPRQTQGWVVGRIGRPRNFDVEAETLPLAVCLFAKKLLLENAARTVAA